MFQDVFVLNQESNQGTACKRRCRQESRHQCCCQAHCIAQLAIWEIIIVIFNTILAAFTLDVFYD